MMWLGPLVVGIVLGLLGAKFWEGKSAELDAQRRPTIWFRRKTDDRLFRMEYLNVGEDGGKGRTMTVLYDTEERVTGLWTYEAFQSDFRPVRNPEL